MDKKELFIDFMEKTANIALATCTDGRANVRMVSIGFDREDPSVLYFVTGSDSNKAADIKKNPEVSFVPAPDKPDTDVFIRVHGKAAEAQIPVERIAELIGRHLPQIAEQIPAMLPGLIAVEIRYSEAEISLDMAEPEIITF